MSDTLIRDNKDYGSVGEFLKDVVKEGSELSVVSAYFTIFAYYGLHNQLDSIKSMKFLFGEPTFVTSDNVDVRNYKIEDESIVINPTEKFGQKRIATKCADWIRNKVEIKSIVKPNFLHGKMYYTERHIQDISEVKAISGSSNFTTSGLGLKDKANNIELNLIVDSDRQKDELKGWFDKIWNDDTGLVQDVKEEVLKYLELLYKENEPELVYFKTLYSIFKDYLDEQKDNKLFDETAFKDTVVWNMLYEFQKDGVKGAINKLLKHNGCIIADSVGLGKTFEALAVIKYFELRNYRVLVLCPKKLSDNWTVYQASKNSTLNILAKDRFQYNILYHTDMGRETGKSGADGHDFATFNWSAYDLVVIDESHNFKGNPMDKENYKGERHMNRAKWLMEKIIKSGSKTKVLMLSATPVNNTLKDLRNQINLITEGDQAALYESTGISNISQTLETAQKQFTYWADPHKNPDRTTKQLLEKLDSSFFKLLDELTIARSRKHITKFYNEADVGKFPDRKKPIPIYSNIDTEDMFPSYAAIDEQISKYKLAIFTPSSYLKEDKKAEYAAKAGSTVEAFIQEDREKSLIGMMKIGYLKRLESSIHSFSLSIKRTIDKISEIEAFNDTSEKVNRIKFEEYIKDAFSNEKYFWRFFFYHFIESYKTEQTIQFLEKNSVVDQKIRKSMELEISELIDKQDLSFYDGGGNRYWVYPFVWYISILYNNVLPEWFNKKALLKFVAFPAWALGSGIGIHSGNLFNWQSWNSVFEWILSVSNYSESELIEYAIRIYPNLKYDQSKTQIISYLIEKIDSYSQFKEEFTNLIVQESIIESDKDYESANKLSILNCNILQAFWNKNTDFSYIPKIIDKIPYEKYSDNDANYTRTAMIEYVCRNANLEQGNKLIKNIMKDKQQNQNSKSILLAKLGDEKSIISLIDNYLSGGAYSDSIFYRSNAFGSKNPSNKLLRKYINLFKYSTEKNCESRNNLQTLSINAIKNAANKKNYKIIQKSINKIISERTSSNEYIEFYEDILNEIEQTVFSITKEGK